MSLYTVTTVHCHYSTLSLLYTVTTLHCHYCTLSLLYTVTTLHYHYSTLSLLYTVTTLHCHYYILSLLYTITTLHYHYSILSLLYTVTTLYCVSHSVRELLPANDELLSLHFEPSSCHLRSCRYIWQPRVTRPRWLDHGPEARQNNASTLNV